MDSTHAAVGLGGTGVTTALTILLTNSWGFDAAHASAAAFLLTTGAGFIYGVVNWYIKWKWPDAPPLPERVVLTEHVVPEHSVLTEHVINDPIAGH